MEAGSEPSRTKAARGLNNHDSVGLRETISQFSHHLNAGYQVGLDSGFVTRPFDGIAFAGMGGSGIGGRLLSSLLATRLDKPVISVSSSVLPSWIGPDSLVVLTSYSGSTAETLACASRAAERGAHALVVSTGGQLSAMANSPRFSGIEIPAGLMPRAALGLIFGAIGGAFVNAGLVSETFIAEAIAGSASPDLQIAQTLGAEIAHGIPVIYGAGPLSVVAYRWKTQLNENAKMSAFASEIPEALHNEIEAFRGEGGPNFMPILLRGSAGGAYAESRFPALATHLHSHGYAIAELPSSRETDVGQVFDLLALGDWVSYYAALERKIDPGPIPIISYVKSH